MFPPFIFRFALVKQQRMTFILVMRCWLMQKSGNVDPDIFIAKSNQLAEQLRKAKQQKERLLDREQINIIDQTQLVMDVLMEYPDTSGVFNEELFCELIDKIIVDSNTKIRFRLKNGLELPETIERTVR